MTDAEKEKQAYGLTGEKESKLLASDKPDAWINESVTDPQDKEVGKVGYEINFNRYFYRYEPPRPLAEIGADIQRLESEIAGMLAEMTT